jgi:hypothetical protein
MAEQASEAELDAMVIEPDIRGIRTALRVLRESSCGRMSSRFFYMKRGTG